MGADNNARARSALATTTPPGENAASLTVSALLREDAVKRRFESVLGDKAAAFMSSVISVTNGSRQLREADPKTIIAAAAVAASLDLPINPSLGFAYIVPYRNRGRSEAQFQIGYKGYIQLALRAGQYKTINVGPVYEGEIEPPTPQQRLQGELRWAEKPQPSTKVIGYAAYFRMLNGAEKWDYMTIQEVEAHARRFSKSYGTDSSPWKTDFDAMACKTVLKRLLSKYGILSVQMQTGVMADQAIVRETPDGGEGFDYADDGDGVIDVTPDAEAAGDRADPEQPTIV